MQINSDTLYVYIGGRLRERRRALGLTQAQVAQRLGVTRTSITNIEAGRQKLPLDLLYELCVALNLDVATLVPPLDVVATTAMEVVTVAGLKGRMPPRTASLVRALQDQLEEERDAGR